MIGKISPKGNRLINDEQVISIGGISTGKKLEKKAIIKGVERLKKYYGQHGYLNAQVQAHPHLLSKTQVHLKYEIKEKHSLVSLISFLFGPPIRILKIRFCLH